MRFQKAIKRMIALGTGAIMLSSFASAAVDLANYPAPFIKDGKFSGFLVVGDKAAAEDVIGVSDIAVSLQAAAVTKVTTTTPGQVSVEGDAWKVGTSTKRLELSEDLTAGTATDLRELLMNITTFIQKGDLKALDSGSVTNNKATSPYNQYLYLLGGTTSRNLDSGYVVYTESDDDVSADFLFFKSSREFARYLAEFTTALESDVDDSAGSSSTTGLFLTDMQDVDVTLFGKKYTIVTAKRTSTVGSSAELTLMGGAGKDTLLEKQTKTYTIGGKNYEVTLNFVDADEAQFTVNGQTTRKLKDGDTDKLSDGTTVGVTDILYQDYAGGIHSSTFFIGAQKLFLKDSDVVNIGIGENALKVDDNTIDDAIVTLEGSDTNSTFKITRVHVNMSADDDFYVPAGGKLSEAIKKEGGSTAEPEVLFTSNWDIEYRGLSKETMETVRIRTSGSSEYNLEFQDGDGNKVSVPIAKAPSGASVIFGEQAGRALINKENRTISKDDYFVLSDSTAGRKRGERPTYVMQYKGSDKVTNDNPLLKFKNLGSGKTVEQSYSAATSLTAGIGPSGESGSVATLKVGGSDFKIFNATSIKSNDFGIVVDLNADGAIAASVSAQGYNLSPVVITSKSGLEINVTNETGMPNEDTTDIVFVTFRMPDEARDGTARDSVETLQATVMRWNLTAASAKVQMAQDTTTETRRINLRTPSGETNIAYGYDSYGTKYTYETPTNDPATIKLEIPAKQSVPLVYITAQGASFSEVGVSSTDAVTLQRIEVGATKLASEVKDVKAQNTILVGGPCANAAAATVMGNPADCTEGFTPGEGIVQLFEHANGNVAMLVAGYAGVDTRNAAQVVSNYGSYKGQLKGMKVVVKKVNNQLTVAAPVTV